MTRPARGDLVAAVSVALILVPQALAYAWIAGLDPVYGLYAAVAAPLAGALVGSSPYLATGPVAVTSLLTFGALAPLAEPRSAEFAALAALLAVIVGLVRMAFGLAGAGPIAYLMSQPVVVSFTSAAALLIIGTQIPALLGVDVEADNPLVGAARVLSDPGEWVWTDLALGAVAFVVLLGGRRVWSLFPGALVAVVAGTTWSQLTGYDGAVVGQVTLELHAPGGFSVGDVLSLVVPGLVIAVVGFAEPASIARKYAALDRHPWD
ncbi:MAG: SulP family inorganic anion transporter, partial [Nocardioides sp.]